MKEVYFWIQKSSLFITREKEVNYFCGTSIILFFLHTLRFNKFSHNIFQLYLFLSVIFVITRILSKQFWLLFYFSFFSFLLRWMGFLLLKMNLSFIFLFILWGQVDKIVFIAIISRLILGTFSQQLGTQFLNIYSV